MGSQRVCDPIFLNENLLKDLESKRTRSAHVLVDRAGV